jgi:predicted Zn-dependent protease
MRGVLRAGLLAVGLLTASCATVPAPAEAQAQAISQRDRQEGAQAHRQIVQQFGGEVEGPVADYVRRVGLRVALVAIPGSRPEDWTITVLSSPVPNAMAVPGGYLYITRGLLGMMNSEAELASVLGHEAGHIAGRHAQRRQAPAIAAMAGTILSGVLLGGQAAQVAQTLGAAGLGQYSQGQENEADTLGLRYMAQAGYDPRAAASMLQALERVSTVEGRQQLERPGLASIFASHPVTASRVRRVAAEAARMPQQGTLAREPFLAAIDGLTWGDDASQGLIDGPRFRHGTLGFGFAAPPGYQISNSPTVVAGRGPDGGVFRFSGAAIQPGQSLENIAAEVWRQATGNVPNIRPVETRVNGFQALVAPARVNTRSGAQDVTVSVIRWSDSQAFVFLTQARPGNRQPADSLLGSFRRLTEAEAAEARRERRIRVVTVRAGDTAESLAARMASPYDRPQSFLALNGIEARELVPGKRVKLITR